jgi:eukaryotic-like serine/threonine-protein kinase
VGFEVGQRVADYEIVSLLGVGGMGRVYRVRNVISHRTEAMKVLLADLSAEPGLAARFVGEIRTLAGLDHPNIAQLHTALQTGNELVMMMEFVDGLTLQQLAQKAPLPEKEVVEYMHQVLAALNFAHSHGVVHRDIKPANIMVTPQGTVKLTDFGIAKSKSKAEDELTRPGTTVGSLYYMSPEQAHGGGAIDGRSDIYSVGITMYELLAGRRPFEDESAYVILHSQLNVLPRPPIDINPLLSKPLSDLILKALEKDPAKRFQTAAAVSDALRRVTGIAPSTPIKSGGIFGPVTGSITAGGGRVVRGAVASASPRSSTIARRRLWIAAEGAAVLVVLVVSALGLPHFLKLGAMAKTVGHSITQSPSLTTAPHDGVAAIDPGQNAATTFADPIGISNNNAVPAPAVSAAETVGYSTTQSPSLPIAPQDGVAGTTSQENANATPDNDKAAAPAVVSAPPQARSTAGSLSQRGRPAGPKVSRVNYQPASLPEVMPNVEEDTTPSVPASPVTELQRVRKQKAELDARAGAISISMQRLKTQKEADGEGLSQFAAGAYARMNAYLGAEKMDLEDGDVASARDHMNKAESEANVLENLFSK